MLAARQRGLLDGRRSWRLLSTDADTLVPATWIEDHLAHAAAGAVAVAGSVRLIADEDASDVEAAWWVADACGAALLGSLFWALQWRPPADLGSADLPTVHLGRGSSRARRRAAAEHRSQMTATTSTAPVVWPEHLWVHDADREPFCLERPGP